FTLNQSGYWRSTLIPACVTASACTVTGSLTDERGTEQVFSFIVSSSQVYSEALTVSELSQTRVRWSGAAARAEPPRSRAVTVTGTAAGARPGSASDRSRCCWALPARSDGMEK